MVCLAGPVGIATRYVVSVTHLIRTHQVLVFHGSQRPLKPAWGPAYRAALTPGHQGTMGKVLRN